MSVGGLKFSAPKKGLLELPCKQSQKVYSYTNTSILVEQNEISSFLNI
jgi:hypothetical protein